MRSIMTLPEIQLTSHWRNNGTPIINAMTVDVEDYFHVNGFEDVVRREDWDKFPSRVEANIGRLLAILADHSVQATFFVLGWVADRFPGLVKEIHVAGHEIACHSYWHRLLYDQTPVQFRDDTRQAKAILEDITGAPVRGYRAPSYSIVRRTLWAFDVLGEAGFTYDSSVYPILRDRYGIPDAPRFPYRVRANGGSLTEIPLATVRLLGANLPVAGGGYLRLFPERFTHWAIRWVNRREGMPVVSYIHPWELDPDQPRLRGGRLSTFRHYINLHETEGRLRSLLREHRFGPARDLVAVVAGQGG